MRHAFLLCLLLPVLSAAAEKPPLGFAEFYPYFAETAVMRAHNNWLSANIQRAIGDITCTRGPSKTAFFCQTKADENNFFCAAASQIDRQKLKAVAEGRTTKFDARADKNLRIYCEGDNWFCEQQAGENNQCWAREIYEKKHPLKTKTANPGDLACLEHEKARQLIQRYLPGKDTTEKLQYLGTGDDRAAAIFIRDVCDFLKKN